MIWIEFHEDKNIQKYSLNIVTYVFYHYKKYYFCGDYLNVTYFGGESLNVYLHYSIMQHLFNSQ